VIARFTLQPIAANFFHDVHNLPADQAMALAWMA
jgi:hypothetical protein